MTSKRDVSIDNMARGNECDSKENDRIEGCLDFVLSGVWDDLNAQR